MEPWELKEFQEVMGVFLDNKVQFHHRRNVYELLSYTGMWIGELQSIKHSCTSPKMIGTCLRPKLEMLIVQLE